MSFNRFIQEPAIVCAEEKQVVSQIDMHQRNRRNEEEKEKRKCEWNGHVFAPECRFSVQEWNGMYFAKCAECRCFVPMNRFQSHQQVIDILETSPMFEYDYQKKARLGALEYLHSAYLNHIMLQETVYDIFTNNDD